MVTQDKLGLKLKDWSGSWGIIVEKIRMIPWMSGHTRKYRIKDSIIEKVGGVYIAEKIVQSYLRQLNLYGEDQYKWCYGR